MPPKAAPSQPPPGRLNAPEGQTTGQTATNPASQTASAPKTEPQATSTPGASGAPARAPVQRLQSLKKPTPGGSIPRASSAAPSPGLGGPGGAPAKPTLKYQPRAVARRSKEEREAIEKLEAERHQERLREAAAMQRGRGGVGPGGRGGFGRGRGGRLGADVGGPLGSGMAGRRGRGGAFGGRFGPDSRTSSISRRSATRSVIDRGSAAAAGDVSSDESDSGIRVSIDQINLESDEEFDEPLDEKAKGKMPVKGPARREKGLRPIRVERHEHEERQVGVNTEASSSTSAELRRQAKEKAAQDNALFVEEDGAAPSVETEPKIKQEPTDEDMLMTDAIPHVSEVSGAATTDDEGLPEQRVRVRRKVTPKQKEIQKEKEKEKVKDPRSLLRTKEEIEEFERHAHDLEVMKDLLSIEERPPRDQEAADAKTGADGAADMDEEVVKDKLSGQLFLLQFPPMTPNLAVPGDAQESVEAAEEDVTITGATTTAPPGGPAIKREEEGAEVQEVGAKPAPQEVPKLVTAAQQQLPAGRVGKLHLHASGRVTLDWGGISFELDRATEVDFLQEAVIASPPSTAAAAAAEGEDVKPEPEEKMVWAMGQLSGKFVVTPNWEKILS